MKVSGEKADLHGQAKAELQVELERALRRPKSFSNVPTPERTARAGAAPKINRVVPHAGESSPKAYAFEAPLEAISHKLFANEYHAAERLRWAHENRTAHARIGDYGTSAGRTDPSMRNGLSAAHQRAAKRWAFFEPYLPPVRDVLDAMLLLKSNGESPTVGDAMEWARSYTPTTYDKTAKPVWEVALRRACRYLAWLDRAYDRQQAKTRAEATRRRERQFAGDGR